MGFKKVYSKEVRAEVARKWLKSRMGIMEIAEEYGMSPSTVLRFGREMYGGGSKREYRRCKERSVKSVEEGRVLDKDTVFVIKRVWRLGKGEKTLEEMAKSIKVDPRDFKKIVNREYSGYGDVFEIRKEINCWLEGDGEFNLNWFCGNRTVKNAVKKMIRYNLKEARDELVSLAARQNSTVLTRRKRGKEAFETMENCLDSKNVDMFFDLVDRLIGLGQLPPKDPK